jgi:hypothetical protein
MSHESTDRDRGIRDVSANCVNLFRLRLSDPETASYEAVEKQYQSFNVWTAYTGALAPRGASLDDRLNAMGQIKIAVLELLKLINESLQRSSYTSTARQWRVLTNSIEQLSVVAESEEFVLKPLNAIEEALESLHKLALAIRRSSAPNSRFNLSSEFSRIDETYEPYFEDLAKKLVRTAFRSAKKSLCEQLGVSISRRRKRILYQMRHNDKLKPQKVNVRTELVTTDSVHQSAAPTTPKETIESKTRIQPIRAAPTLMSTTDASLPNKSIYRRVVQRQSPSIVSSRYGSSVRNHDIEYPDPPHFEISDTVRQCPYCAEPMPKNSLNGSNAQKYWRSDDFICFEKIC